MQQFSTMTAPNAPNSPNSVTNFPVTFVNTIRLPALRGGEHVYSIPMTIERVMYFRDRGMFNHQAASMSLEKLVRLHHGANPREIGDLYDLQGGYDENGTAYRALLVGWGIFPMEIKSFFWRYGVQMPPSEQALPGLEGIVWGDLDDDSIGTFSDVSTDTTAPLT